MSVIIKSLIWILNDHLKWNTMEYTRCIVVFWLRKFAFKIEVFCQIFYINYITCGKENS